MASVFIKGHNRLGGQVMMGCGMRKAGMGFSVGFANDEEEIPVTGYDYNLKDAKKMARRKGVSQAQIDKYSKGRGMSGCGPKKRPIPDDSGFNDGKKSGKEINTDRAQILENDAQDDMLTEILSYLPDNNMAPNKRVRDNLRSDYRQQEQLRKLETMAERETKDPKKKRELLRLIKNLRIRLGLDVPEPAKTLKPFPRGPPDGDGDGGGDGADGLGPPLIPRQLGFGGAGFKKGSAEMKAHMAKLRSMRKK